MRFNLIAVCLAGIILTILGSPSEIGRSYQMQCIRFPYNRHEEFPQVEEDYQFIEELHLKLENPEFIKTLDFDKLSFPTSFQHQLGYSAPFRVLSDEGVRRLRQVIDTHYGRAKGNERQQKILRGLGYLSKFVEELIYSSELLEHVSEIAGEPLCPNTFGMHIAQVNFGKPGNVDADVDKWHFDSVDYVLVIILSDIQDMVGGKLEVLEKNLGGKAATLQLAKEGIPESLTRQQTYQAAGFGIMAQGSKILHRVTPVLEAKEDRISFIISLNKADAFGEDNTRTLKYCKDPEDIVAWEMAKHEAWRQQGKLQWLIEESNPNLLIAEAFAEFLDESAARLQRAARIIRNEEADAVGFVATPNF